MTPEEAHKLLFPTMSHACHMRRHKTCKGYGFAGLHAFIENERTPCECSCHKNPPERNA